MLTFSAFDMATRAMPATAGLSVFFPAYNDSGTIASMVVTAVQTARRLTSDFEVDRKSVV